MPEEWIGWHALVGGSRGFAAAQFQSVEALEKGCSPSTAREILKWNFSGHVPGVLASFPEFWLVATRLQVPILALVSAEFQLCKFELSGRSSFFC